MRTKATKPVKEKRKSRIFISFARADILFAERLRGFLEKRDFETFIDFSDISSGEVWQKNLSELISSVDAVIFCLSKSFASSEICQWEVDYAEQMDKALFPVVIEEVSVDEVPYRLARIHFLFMRPEDDLEKGLERLFSALNRNIKWFRYNTFISEIARDWNDANRPVRRLLQDIDIGVAEKWLAATPREISEPSELVREFIEASRAKKEARHWARKARASLSPRKWLIHLQDITRLSLSMTKAFGRGLFFMLLFLVHSFGFIVKSVLPPALFLLPLLIAFGWHYYDRQLTISLEERSVLDSLWGKRKAGAHAGALRAVHFSVDGKTVTTTGYDGKIRDWEASTGKWLASRLTKPCDIEAFERNHAKIFADLVAGDAKNRSVRVGAREALARQVPTSNPVPVIACLFEIMKHETMDRKTAYRINIGLLSVLGKVKEHWQPTREQSDILQVWSKGRWVADQTYLQLIEKALLKRTRIPGFVRTLAGSPSVKWKIEIKEATQALYTFTAVAEGKPKLFDKIIKRRVVRGGIIKHGAIIDYVFVDHQGRGITIGEDGVVRVWRFEQNPAKQSDPVLSLIATIRGHGHGHGDVIAHAAISPDGTKLLTADWQGHAQIIDLTKIGLQAYLPFDEAQVSIGPALRCANPNSWLCEAGVVVKPEDCYRGLS